MSQQFLWKDFYLGFTLISNIGWIKPLEGTLKSLTINGLDWSNLAPDYFSNFTNLNVLLSSSCSLSSFHCPENAPLQHLQLMTNSLLMVPDLQCLKDTLLKLGLNENAITNVEDNALSGFGLLKELTLRNNELTSFSCSSISGTVMELLDLELNSLQTFPNLQCIARSLTVLKLTENSISLVQKTDVEFLTNLNTLLLGKNTISCLEWVITCLSFQSFICV